MVVHFIHMIIIIRIISSEILRFVWILFVKLFADWRILSVNGFAIVVDDSIRRCRDWQRSRRA